MLSYGGVTSGSLADTSGNCVNDFRDGYVSVIELSLLSELYYRLTLLDIFFAFCPLAHIGITESLITLTYKPFLVFPSAPVYFCLAVCGFFLFFFFFSITESCECTLQKASYHHGTSK